MHLELGNEMVNEHLRPNHKPENLLKKSKYCFSGIYIIPIFGHSFSNHKMRVHLKS
jgi:hypothetical protein